MAKDLGEKSLASSDVALDISAISGLVATAGLANVTPNILDMLSGARGSLVWTTIRPPALETFCSMPAFLRSKAMLAARMCSRLDLVYLSFCAISP